MLIFPRAAGRVSTGQPKGVSPLCGYLRIDEALWILAIAHGHMEPEYWIDRKQDTGQPGASSGTGKHPEAREAAPLLL